MSIAPVGEQQSIRTLRGLKCCMCSLPTLAEDFEAQRRVSRLRGAACWVARPNTCEVWQASADKSSHCSAAAFAKRASARPVQPGASFTGACKAAAEASDETAACEEASVGSTKFPSETWQAELCVVCCSGWLGRCGVYHPSSCGNHGWIRARRCTWTSDYAAVLRRLS